MFIIEVFLKLLYKVEVLLIDNHQILKLEREFLYNFEVFHKKYKYNIYN